MHARHPQAERTRSAVLAVGLGGVRAYRYTYLLGDEHLGHAKLASGRWLWRTSRLLYTGVNCNLAREFDLPEQQLWRLARHAMPVSRANLTAYGNLLGTLGNAFLKERYSTILQRTLAETNNG